MKKRTGLPLALLITAFYFATVLSSANSYTLQIYGNANMDDTINEQDIKYVQGIIDGSNNGTSLADANYDDKIDENDISQIKMIIDGDEKNLTIIDDNGRIETIKTPVNKLVCFYARAEYPIAIGAKNAIVGSDMTYLSKYARELFYGSDLADVADVGSSNEPNYEKIIELMPDLVISPQPLTSPDLAGNIDSHLPDEIPVAGLDFNLYVGDLWYQNTMMLGYLTNHVDEAKELVDWVQGYESTLIKRTENLTVNEKPTVLAFSSSGKVQTTDHGAGMIESICGGRNLASKIVPANSSSAEASNEWILEQNPDVIFIVSSLGWNATTKDAESMLKKFTDKPGWNKMSAVVNHRIYLIDYNNMINRYIIGACCIAKCLHPEIYKDISPENVNKEYFEKFLGCEAGGVWMYPAAPST